MNTWKSLWQYIRSWVAYFTVKAISFACVMISLDGSCTMMYIFLSSRWTCTLRMSEDSMRSRVMLKSSVLIASLAW